MAMRNRVALGAVATVVLTMTACNPTPGVDADTAGYTTVTGTRGTPAGNESSRPADYDAAHDGEGNAPTTSTGSITPTATATATADDLDDALQPQKMWEREHTLRDGRTVTCLYVQNAGLSCDWSKAGA